MSSRFDVVVIGAGPAGEVVVNTLLKAGKQIALVEREVIGGECSNWGCVPSKTLLRPPELRGQSTRAAGVATPALDFDRLAAYRDYIVSNHDDSRRIARYEDRGVAVLKEEARIVGPGRVAVDGRIVETGAIVVATGAEPVIPPIPGLAEAGYWTNRQVTDLTELPESAVFIGGGVVSVELGQFLARFGTRVTIVQGPPTLANREEPRIGELLAETLAESGIELRLGRRAEAVRRENGESVVTLDDGSEASGAALVVATGRAPRVDGLGLESAGIEPGPRGIIVDDRCRAGEGVWAIGDVTGVAMFTHVGKYQARIAAATALRTLPDERLLMGADHRAHPMIEQPESVPA